MISISYSTTHADYKKFAKENLSLIVTIIKKESVSEGKFV
jgi:hypothetical protein